MINYTYELKSHRLHGKNVMIAIENDMYFIVLDFINLEYIDKLTECHVNQNNLPAKRDYFERYRASKRIINWLMEKHQELFI